jgi:hypothetical protein
MSGGSYNYLYIKDARELHDATNDLEAIRDRLAGLGYADDAAQAVTDILDSIREFEKTIDAKMVRLRDVLRSVEWWDSADSGEDAVRDALDQFRRDES